MGGELGLETDFGGEKGGVKRGMCGKKSERERGEEGRREGGYVGGNERGRGWILYI